MEIKKLDKSFDIVIDNLASDKSISHRFAIFSLLSNGKCRAKNFLMGEDTLNSLNIAKQLGAKVIIGDSDSGSDSDMIEYGDVIIIPPKKIIEPKDVLYCGNAGTGMRLYCGLLSGIEGSFILTGDKYLNNRPMKRVTAPLNKIGAKIDGRDNGNLAPLHIRGGKLKSFNYDSPISSAQVKSALILSALNSCEKCTITEPILSRNHSENILRGMGTNIKSFKKDNKFVVEVEPLKDRLKPLDITIPADPSSGFFFAVAASIIPNSKVLLKNISLNKTRIEAYKILKKMGANVNFILKDEEFEPIGDIEVSYNQLNGVKISENISWLIDELPALSIAMALSKGKSIVRNAKELRVKESDRIATVVTNLQKCGIEVKEFDDGYEIIGGYIKKANLNSFGDHRVAMSFIIAGLVSGMKVADLDCINTSFPNFFEIMGNLRN